MGVFAFWAVSPSWTVSCKLYVHSGEVVATVSRSKTVPIANPLWICSDYLAISFCCLILTSSWCHRALDSPSASLRECQSWCSTCCQKLQAITELAMLCTVSENHYLILPGPCKTAPMFYVSTFHHTMIAHWTKFQRLRTHARMAFRKIGRASSCWNLIGMCISLHARKHSVNTGFVNVSSCAFFGSWNDVFSRVFRETYWTLPRPRLSSP